MNPKIEMYLVKTPYLLKKIYPSSLIWNMPRTERAVYLTFDDGPIPEVTPWVLDTLKEFQAAATFFCIGDNVRKYPETFRRILDEGHSAGNHTFHHLNGWKTADEHYLENIAKCAELVNSRLFRPPYGRIRRSQIRKLCPPSPPPAAADGWQLIMWDVLSGDFDTGLSPGKCLENVLKHTRGGSVVVFHDSLKAEKRLRYALPLALERWKNQGFVFKKLPY